MFWYNNKYYFYIFVELCNYIVTKAFKHHFWVHVSQNRVLSLFDDVFSMEYIISFKDWCNYFLWLWKWWREKSRITLSVKQLEEDPLLETLDKVIPQVLWCYFFFSFIFLFFLFSYCSSITDNWSASQDASVDSDTLSANDHLTIDPLPGLDIIIGELLKEDGYD